MTRLMQRALGVLACAIALPAGANTLVVEVTGFADASGQAAVELFASRAGFLKQSSRLEVQPIVAGQPVRWQFDDLAPSDYAVRVWHDINSDGELDRPTFGRNEVYMFSHGSREQRPDWDDVTVTLGPDPVTVSLDLSAPDD